MSALETTAVNGKQPRSFASGLNALKTRLCSMPSAYDVSEGLSSRGWGTEVARRQGLQKRELRSIKQDLDVLCLEIKLAELNLRTEQAQRTTQSSRRENHQLKREEAQ